MNVRWLGSWPAIIAIWLVCAGWTALGLPPEALTLVLSIIALSFSQVILMDTTKLTDKQNEKLDAIVHGTDADDSVADDTP